MLCANYLVLELPICRSTPYKKMKTSYIILVVVLTSAAVFSTCLAIILSKSRIHSKSEIDQSCKELKKFSYSDFAKATNEFSAANLIGSGRFGMVYRGTFRFESHPVAIKVFKLDQIGPKNFVTECEVFVRNKTLTLIEREDDTRSWGNFLVYFSHFTTMSCPPRGWRYIFIGC
jgi:hypothetical protein